jgi:adenylate cyclase
VETRLSKAIVLGLLTGMVGLIASLFSLGVELEENLGLEILFHLRGVRRPPQNVVIVGIDKISSDNLGLPNDPRKWPRSLHASLIDVLARQGAAVIAFDIVFEDPRVPENDNLFSTAVRTASNVVLCERIRVDKVRLTDHKGSSRGDVNLVKLVPPIPPLERSAAALAPFPLPKVPVKVSQYWTFKTGAGDTPTLPVVAFQLFAGRVFTDFKSSLEKVSPYSTEKVVLDIEKASSTKNIGRLILDVRDIFEKEPLTAEKILRDTAASKAVSSVPSKRKLIKSLVRMYEGPNSRYLNFYGPPRTITTIPYYRALQFREGAAGNGQPDLRGKAVFVGLSDVVQPEQKDGFNTVFTQADGLDIAGVEIAATAFANLLEDMPLRPLSLPAFIAVIFLWGALIGVLCRYYSNAVAALSLIGLSALYLTAVLYIFTKDGIWFPVVFPLFFQTFFAFNAALLWKYVDSNKERQNVRKALSYYLPGEVIDGIERNMLDLKEGGQLVYGICLSTDAEHYTALCEAMEPDKLSSFMNRYYEAVFDPVKRHEGVVSNVIGDSMLAIWVSKNPDPVLKNKACLAALDIADSISCFNQSNENSQLPTRIGLHSGHVMLGNIGAIDHYEYRPIGDIVNTATRIEGLNKYLGTQVLVSEEVVYQLDGLLSRQIGKFLLAGKSRPLVVHELMSRAEDAYEKQKTLCSVFSRALEAFGRQGWDEAIEQFNEVIRISGVDGPSHFYITLCLHFKNNPPGESWNGVVHMDKK